MAATSISRGFFRLWVVLSIVWVVAAVADLAWSLHGRRGEWMPQTYRHAYPVDCREARSLPSRDEEGTYLFEKDFLGSGRDVCVYDEDKFRKAFPEYAGMTVEAAHLRVYSQLGIPLSNDHFTAKEAFSWLRFTLMPPLLVFLAVVAALWVRRGFRPS